MPHLIMTVLLLDGVFDRSVLRPRSPTFLPLPCTTPSEKRQALVVLYRLREHKNVAVFACSVTGAIDNAFLARVGRLGRNVVFLSWPAVLEHARLVTDPINRTPLVNQIDAARHHVLSQWWRHNTRPRRPCFDDMFADPNNRLIIVSGPSGVGKTWYSRYKITRDGGKALVYSPDDTVYSPSQFVDRIAARGFNVVLFDNGDGFAARRKAEEGPRLMALVKAVRDQTSARMVVTVQNAYAKNLRDLREGAVIVEARAVPVQLLGRFLYNVISNPVSDVLDFAVERCAGDIRRCVTIYEDVKNFRQTVARDMNDLSKITAADDDDDDDDFGIARNYATQMLAMQERVRATPIASLFGVIRCLPELPKNLVLLECLRLAREEVGGGGETPSKDYLDALLAAMRDVRERVIGLSPGLVRRIGHLFENPFRAPLPRICRDAYALAGIYYPTAARGRDDVEPSQSSLVKVGKLFERPTVSSDEGHLESLRMMAEDDRRPAEDAKIDKLLERLEPRIPLTDIWPDYVAPPDEPALEVVPSQFERVERRKQEEKSQLDLYGNEIDLAVELMAENYPSRFTRIADFVRCADSIAVSDLITAQRKTDMSAFEKDATARNLQLAVGCTALAPLGWTDGFVRMRFPFSAPNRRPSAEEKHAVPLALAAYRSRVASLQFGGRLSVCNVPHLPSVSSIKRQRLSPDDIFELRVKVDVLRRQSGANRSPENLARRLLVYGLSETKVRTNLVTALTMHYVAPKLFRKDKPATAEELKNFGIFDSKRPKTIRSIANLSHKFDDSPKLVDVNKVVNKLVKLDAWRRPWEEVQCKGGPPTKRRKTPEKK